MAGDPRDPVRAELQRRIDKAVDDIGGKVIRGQCGSFDEYKARCGEAKGLMAAMELYDQAFAAVYGAPDDDDDKDLEDL